MKISMKVRALDFLDFGLGFGHAKDPTKLD